MSLNYHVNKFHGSPAGAMPASFPSRHGCRIHPQFLGELFPGQTLAFAHEDQLLFEVRRFRERVVAKEFYDPGNEPYLWHGSLPFPVVNCGLIYPYFLRDLLLKESQIQSPLPEVVT